MATTTISATYQGQVGISYNALLVNWVTDVRNASVGTYTNTYTTNQFNAAAIYAALVAGRGGTSTGLCSRTFLYFDLSSVGGTITSATLKVLGYSTSTSEVIPVEGTPTWGLGSLGLGDYDSLDHSTPYASAITSWNTAGYNNFTLNSTAISDMNTNSELNVCLIDNVYDYNATSPSLGNTYRAGIEFLDPTNPIELEITYDPPYGNTVIGVVSANIGEVNGVVTTDIDNITGV